MSAARLIFVLGGPDQSALGVLGYSPQPRSWGSCSALLCDGYATVGITLARIFGIGLSTVSVDSRPAYCGRTDGFHVAVDYRRLLYAIASTDRLTRRRQFRLCRSTGGTLTPSGRDDRGLTLAVDPVKGGGGQTTVGW